MPSTSPSISRATDPDRYEAVVAVATAAATLAMPLVIVGAWARDLWLRPHAVPAERLTLDTDIALRVESWAHFTRLRELLLARPGFLGDPDPRHPERLRAPGGQLIDLLPFGGVEDGYREIRWPADQVAMSMLGFAEAWAGAVEVPLVDAAPAHIRVVSPAGLILLKLVAWGDRQGNPQARRKHVQDLVAMWENYVYPLHPTRLSTGEDQDLAGAEPDELLVGARLAGRDVARLAGRETSRRVAELVREHGIGKGERLLAQDIRKYAGGSYSRATRCAEALCAGIEDLNGQG